MSSFFTRTIISFFLLFILTNFSLAQLNKEKILESFGIPDEISYTEDGYTNYKYKRNFFDGTLITYFDFDYAGYLVKISYYGSIENREPNFVKKEFFKIIKEFGFVYIRKNKVTDFEYYVSKEFGWNMSLYMQSFLSGTILICYIYLR